MPQFNFDVSSFTPPPSPSREPLPAGMYTVIVTASDIKTTQAGTGQYIELTEQVIDGPHSGRKLWDRLNVSNPNKQAEEIAKKQLQALCLACNVAVLNHTEQLHDIAVLAQVDIDRKDPSRNIIRGYAPLSAMNASSATRQAAPPAQAAAPKPAARPWERK